MARTRANDLRRQARRDPLRAFRPRARRARGRSRLDGADRGWAAASPRRCSTTTGRARRELVFDIVRSHLEVARRRALRGGRSAGARAGAPARAGGRHARRLPRQRRRAPRPARRHGGSCHRTVSRRSSRSERDIVRRFSGVLRLANPALADGPLLAPVTMSLFGMLNWVYLWFGPDGAITREQYADLANAADPRRGRRRSWADEDGGVLMGREAPLGAIVRWRRSRPCSTRPGG